LGKGRRNWEEQNRGEEEIGKNSREENREGEYKQY